MCVSLQHLSTLQPFPRLQMVNSLDMDNVFIKRQPGYQLLPTVPMSTTPALASSANMILEQSIEHIQLLAGARPTNKLVHVPVNVKRTSARCQGGGRDTRMPAPKAARMRASTRWRADTWKRRKPDK